MRRAITVLMAITITLSAYGQLNTIFSKKDDLTSFSSKTTKVVLSDGASIVDMILRDAVKENWTISPFEFATLDEFEEIKCDTNYFFLVKVTDMVDSQDDSAMEFLTLYKGADGGAKFEKNLPEILSLPIQSKDDQSGKIFAFLPSFIKIVQNHVEKVIEKRHSAYIGLSAYTDGMDGAKDKELLFCKEDFGFDITQEMLDEDFNGKAKLVTQEEIEDALVSKRAGTLVSLVVTSSSAPIGSECYKMMISTDTQELYMYRRHKITTKKRGGFTKEDYKKMAVPFSFK